MKAIVKSFSGKGLWLENIPVPSIGVNDVLIKILKTSICGTDLHIYKWDKWTQKNVSVGTTIGHEFVGVVEDFGSNVHDYRKGDLVSGEGHLVCGRCRNCLAGRRHLCPKTKGIGVNRDGAFAEYLSMPVANVWPCDENISLEILSSFDPLGNATHTALSFNTLGEDVLVTGAGPIGLMATAIARHCGARHIVTTDTNRYRLDLAKKMGATVALDVSKNSIEEVQKQLCMTEGFDVGMEMSGNPDAFKDMLKNMCHGGKIALLGILPETAINWDNVVFNGLVLKGIYGREMYETWYKMTMMLQCGLDITPVITHRFHYSEFEKAFEIMRSGQTGKVVLNWQEK